MFLYKNKITIEIFNPDFAVIVCPITPFGVSRYLREANFLKWHEGPSNFNLHYHRFEFDFTTNLM